MRIKNRIATKRTNHIKKALLIGTAVVLAVLVVLAALELTHKIDLVHKTKKDDQSVLHPTAPHSTADSDKGESKTDNSNPSTGSQGSGDSQAEDNKSEEGGVDTNQALIAPSGVFVSNHSPNMSGSPAPKTITSTCNTTPGAKCQIFFTKGDVTKQLPAQTADRGGAAYWSWSIDDSSIGLTVGSWKVTAKATLGNQTKSASDAVVLEIKQ